MHTENDIKHLSDEADSLMNDLGFQNINEFNREYQSKIEKREKYIAKGNIKKLEKLNHDLKLMQPLHDLTRLIVIRETIQISPDINDALNSYIEDALGFDDLDDFIEEYNEVFEQVQRAENTSTGPTEALLFEFDRFKDRFVSIYDEALKYAPTPVSPKSAESSELQKELEDLLHTFGYTSPSDHVEWKNKLLSKLSAASESKKGRLQAKIATRSRIDEILNMLSSDNSSTKNEDKKVEFIDALQKIGIDTEESFQKKYNKKLLKLKNALTSGKDTKIDTAIASISVFESCIHLALELGIVSEDFRDEVNRTTALPSHDSDTSRTEKSHASIDKGKQEVEDYSSLVTVGHVPEGEYIEYGMKSPEHSAHSVRAIKAPKVPLIRKSANKQTDSVNVSNPDQFIQQDDSDPLLDMLGSPAVPQPISTSATLDQREIHELYESYFNALTDMPTCLDKTLIVFSAYVQIEHKRSVINDQQIPGSLFSRDHAIEVLNLLTHQLDLEGFSADQKISYYLSAIKASLSDSTFEITTLREMTTLLKKYLCPLDFPLLLRLLSRTESAIQKIQSKSITLLIGVTGAGKSTTIHFLAGSKMEKVRIDYLPHIQPVEVLNEDLLSFVTSPFSRSETRTINPISIDTENNSILLCDTPGFGDTDGAEVDIANGLGIAKAVRKASEVKPVLLISKMSIGDRTEGLSNLMNILVRFIPGIANHLDSFTYVFTKYPKEDSVDIYPTLMHKHKHPTEVESANPAFMALLESMIDKTESGAYVLDPLHDSRDDLVQMIQSVNPISNPETVFHNFATQDSTNQLLLQLSKHQQSIEKALTRLDLKVVMYKLDQLSLMVEALGLEELETAYMKIMTTIYETLMTIISTLESQINRIVSEGNSDYMNEADDLSSNFKFAFSMLEICDRHMDDVHLSSMLAQLLRRATKELSKRLHQADYLLDEIKIDPYLHDNYNKLIFISDFASDHFPEDSKDLKKILSRAETATMSISARFSKSLSHIQLLFDKANFNAFSHHLKHLEYMKNEFGAPFSEKFKSDYHKLLSDCANRLQENIAFLSDELDLLLLKIREIPVNLSINAGDLCKRIKIIDNASRVEVVVEFFDQIDLPAKRDALLEKVNEVFLTLHDDVYPGLWAKSKPDFVAHLSLIIPVIDAFRQNSSVEQFTSDSYYVLLNQVSSYVTESSTTVMNFLHMLDHGRSDDLVIDLDSIIENIKFLINIEVFSSHPGSFYKNEVITIKEQFFSYVNLANQIINEDQFQLESINIVRLSQLINLFIMSSKLLPVELLLIDMSSSGSIINTIKESFLQYLSTFVSESLQSLKSTVMSNIKTVLNIFSMHHLFLTKLSAFDVPVCDKLTQALITFTDEFYHETDHILTAAFKPHDNVASEDIPLCYSQALDRLVMLNKISDLYLQKKEYEKSQGFIHDYVDDASNIEIQFFTIKPKQILDEWLRLESSFLRVELARISKLIIKFKTDPVPELADLISKLMLLKPLDQYIHNDELNFSEVINSYLQVLTTKQAHELQRLEIAAKHADIKVFVSQYEIVSVMGPSQLEAASDFLVLLAETLNKILDHEIINLQSLELSVLPIQSVLTSSNAISKASAFHMLSPILDPNIYSQIHEKYLKLTTAYKDKFEKFTKRIHRAIEKLEINKASERINYYVQLLPLISPSVNSLNQAQITDAQEINLDLNDAATPSVLIFSSSLYAYLQETIDLLSLDLGRMLQSESDRYLEMSIQDLSVSAIKSYTESLDHSQRYLEVVKLAKTDFFSTLKNLLQDVVEAYNRKELEEPQKKIDALSIISTSLPDELILDLRNDLLAIREDIKEKTSALDRAWREAVATGNLAEAIRVIDLNLPDHKVSSQSIFAYHDNFLLQMKKSFDRFKNAFESDEFNIPFYAGTYPLVTVYQTISLYKYILRGIYHKTSSTALYRLDAMQSTIPDNLSRELRTFVSDFFSNKLCAVLINQLNDYSKESFLVLNRLFPAFKGFLEMYNHSILNENGSIVPKFEKHIIDSINNDKKISSITKQDFVTVMSKIYACMHNLSSDFVSFLASCKFDALKDVLDLSSEFSHIIDDIHEYSGTEMSLFYFPEESDKMLAVLDYRKMRSRLLDFMLDAVAKAQVPMNFENDDAAEKQQQIEGIATAFRSVKAAEQLTRHFDSAEFNVDSKLQSVKISIDANLRVLRDDFSSQISTIPTDNQSIYEKLNQIYDNIMIISETFEGEVDISGSINSVLNAVTNDISTRFSAINPNLNFNSDKQKYDFIRILLSLKLMTMYAPSFKTHADLKIDDMLTDLKRQHNGSIVLGNITTLLNAEQDPNKAPLCQMILAEHSAFKGLQNELFIGLVAKTFDINYVVDRLQNYYPHGKPSGEPERISTKISHTKLIDLYNQFEVLYQKEVTEGLLKPNQQCSEIITNVAMLANQTSRISYQDKIIQLSAYLFAWWTLKNMPEDAFNTSQGSSDGALSTNRLMKPHPAQVTSIFRLLGVDIKKSHLQNHFIEIGTGEGKSITLAITASLMALQGYDVDCACYSEYLSQRDKEDFQALFRAFSVDQYITYGTFNNLCEGMLNRHGVVRDMIINLIDHDDVGDARVSGNTRDKVLLVDEADVFFSPEFYGNTYHPLAELRSSEIKDMVDYIWDRARANDFSSLRFSNIEKTSQYHALCKRYSRWSDLIAEEVKDMLVDIRDFDNVEYVIQDDKIAYLEGHSANTSIHYGYKTIFTYYKECENDNISSESKESKIALIINCGSYSYAEIPSQYKNIMGVTGTLATLSQAERDLLRNDYNIHRYTYMPSVYGDNRLDFQSNNSNYVQIVTDKSQQHWFSAINDMIQDVRGSIGLPVLVFFETNKKLNEFYQYARKNLVSYKDHLKKLNEDTRDSNKAGAIRQATSRSQVTLLSRGFGRGTDFRCFDKQVNSDNGVQVIQTFMSDQLSEETQIKGRTARQGDKGSFRMIISASDLDRYGYNNPDSMRDLRNRGNWYEEISKKRCDYFDSVYRRNAQNVHQIGLDHSKSIKFIQDLLNVSIKKVLSYLIENNKSYYSEESSETARILVLMDATGSMTSLLDNAKKQVGRIMDNLVNILQSNGYSNNFELQFAVYRNYNVRENSLLEHSSWESNPANIYRFMSTISPQGGMGNEAVEIGFSYANQAFEQKPFQEIMLIGDMPPNTRDDVEENRDDYYGFGESYWRTTQYRTPTYWESELSELISKGVKVNTYSIGGGDVVSVFRDIASRTSGLYGPMDVDDDQASDRLAHAASIRVMDLIGGESAVNLYKNTYMKGYVISAAEVGMFSSHESSAVDDSSDYASYQQR